MIVKKVDWQFNVLEQKSEPSEFMEETDEQGRKIRHVVVEKIELPDGTVVQRSKSMPVGVAVLECGHKVPVFSYELAEQLEQMVCTRCSREESRKQGKKVLVRRKKVKVVYREG
jgi:hypothetical protein